VVRLFPAPQPEPAWAESGQWVLIHRVVLPAGSRSPAVPPDTQAVPLEMWVKGRLVGNEGRPAGVGDPVTVRTVTGRLESGTLTAVEPFIPHTFGAPVPELLAVGPELRARLVRPGRSDADASSGPGRGGRSGPGRPGESAGEPRGGPS